MPKNDRLTPIRNFLGSLRPDTDSASESGPFDFGRYLALDDEQSLILGRDEAAEYYDAAKKLLDIYQRGDALSLAAAERALDEAITFVHRTNSGWSDAAIEAALQALDRDLKRAPSLYNCFIPVGGLSDTGLPYSFGPSRFVVFNKTQLGKLRAAWGKGSGKPLSTSRRRSLLDKIAETEIWGSTCITTQVQALDSEAAMSIAETRLRSTIDTLNFFGDVVPYQLGRLYVLGERHRFRQVAPIINDQGHLYINHARVGPIGLFEVAKLRSHRRSQRTQARLKEMLGGAESGVERRLLAGVQWAGRAAAATRSSEAFLWYAIALESVLLPASDRQDLGYRVRLRAAHLLTKTAKTRRALMTEVARLYGIRSAIVHGGATEPTDSDLKSIRNVCVKVLVTLLGARLKEVRTAKEFEQWLEDLTLS